MDDRGAAAMTAFNRYLHRNVRSHDRWLPCGGGGAPAGVGKFYSFDLHGVALRRYRFEFGGINQTGTAIAWLLMQLNQAGPSSRVR